MLKQLHQLIGKQIIHDGKQCTLIEIMNNGPYLVFQCPSEKSIQCNQHGHAQRRSAPTYTIHCLNQNQDDLHPVLKQLIQDSDDSNSYNTLLDDLLKR